MVYQFYVVEVQQYANGEYGHIVHYAFDADQEKARLKGESKYHEVLLEHFRNYHLPQDFLLLLRKLLE